MERVHRLQKAVVDCMYEGACRAGIEDARLFFSQVQAATALYSAYMSSREAKHVPQGLPELVSTRPVSDFLTTPVEQRAALQVQDEAELCCLRISCKGHPGIGRAFELLVEMAPALLQKGVLQVRCMRRSPGAEHVRCRAHDRLDGPATGPGVAKAAPPRHGGLFQLGCHHDEGLACRDSRVQSHPGALALRRAVGEHVWQTAPAVGHYALVDIPAGHKRSIGFPARPANGVVVRCRLNIVPRHRYQRDCARLRE
eukprot:CAMPEP_0181189670 /NCGR_PEP_ID=MMETSP1096-20121128/11784_1 /TAXON_ID=156174 ORGANISM="Chrysochromulina ericina, Strain CCMP281" /NCGR_SAMPLE_ID=MMETSP1096 /ASSEMBLY_ACC=CAM_ASM_000453 /LENGTH=254 /DNA_ID=CAMNT_0023278835 /DNA_START=850 /DNA_END=1611 /DNA_ORIENTATION=-